MRVRLVGMSTHDQACPSPDEMIFHSWDLDKGIDNVHHQCNCFNSTTYQPIDNYIVCQPASNAVTGLSAGALIK